MPRSSILVTSTAVDAAAVAVAAGQIRDVLVKDNPNLEEFELLAVDEGAAVQVRGSNGELMATVTLPRLLLKDHEVSRLLTAQFGALPAGSVWTEAFTPWSVAGAVGMLIVQRIAENLHGEAVHSSDRAGDPLPI